MSNSYLQFISSVVYYFTYQLLILSQAENETNSNIIWPAVISALTLFTVKHCLQLLHKHFTNFQTSLNILNTTFPPVFIMVPFPVCFIKQNA